MISVSNLSLRYGKRILFDEVNLSFAPGNCYGVIGANGAGKSTFLKILSGEIESSTGNVSMEPNARMSVLKQDHFAYDEHPVLQTVIMGNQKLWDVKSEMDAIYAKPDFTDEDGLKAADLSAEFEDMNGWNAESDAAEMLRNLGISEDLHYTQMSELAGNQKVRVLLAQSLFGDPDILLLDEPTNDLDLDAITWLENFLADFKNTVLVVSHDRHFLDTVCTHVVDIDFGKIKLFSGNYAFWYQSSQLALRQRSDKNKKVEDKRKELQDFIRRFSANASKSKQATSRKKLLEKLTLEDIQPSNRKYPAIIFKQSRQAGDQILNVQGLSKSVEGKTLFQDISFDMQRGDKIAVLSKDTNAITTFFEVLTGEKKADKGEYKWGTTITQTYLPNENEKFFEKDLNLFEWLEQYTNNTEEAFIRGFLGQMLFSRDESMKKATVLSGGERVRCMLARMMLQEPNFLVLNEPTNHLDLESITAFNNELIRYPGSLLMYSHDHEFMQTVATRIIEITPSGVINKMMTYDDYINDEDLKVQREAMYSGVVA
ncbi:UNVERIFIED_CONTAM: hypothetical protein GTU68_018928 [Idotea baltica]|nr:hypothetical protein [Idotea baltica]